MKKLLILLFSLFFLSSPSVFGENQDADIDEMITKKHEEIMKADAEEKAHILKTNLFTLNKDVNPKEIENMNYALRAFEKQNYENALYFIRRCIKSSNATIKVYCSNLLGYMHLEGLQVEQDYDKALLYFSYRKGMSIEEKDQVLKWVKKAEDGIKLEKK